MSDTLLTAPVHRRRRPWKPDFPLWTSALLALPLIVMVAIFVVTPLALLVAQSFDSGIDAYTGFFESPAQQKALLTTFGDSALVTVVSVVVGALIAWKLRTSENKIVRALLWSVVVIPFLMGVVVKNYAMGIILQGGGLLSDLLQLLPFVDEPVNLMYTPTAVVLGITYSLLPYAIMIMSITFNSVDTDLVRAAEVTGATRTGAVFGVVLPLASPGLLASAALIFMLSIGFYVTPVMLGGAQSPFMASLIHRQIFVMFDNAGAAASGTILIAAAIVVLGLLVAAVGTRRLKGALR